MGLCGLFAILTRILIAVIFGPSLSATITYAVIMAAVLVAWSIYYRVSMKANFEENIRKFEIESSQF